MAGKSSNARIIVIVLVLVVLAIVGGVLIAVATAPNVSLGQMTPETVNTSYTAMPILEDEYDSWDDSVIRDGVTYYPNRNITTIIFMGIDQTSDFEGDEILGNGGRADTMMLFIMDNERRTINILEINRDTWTSVDVYDDSRNLLYSGDMQLCLQYSFSDSLTRGCIITKNKVSEILYGIDIDNYCSLTLDGMANIIDAMGGLQITFDDDLSFIDPSFGPNTTLTINSEQAERLFRYRDRTQVGSNQGRMSRASFVMRQVFDSLMGSSSETIQSYIDAAGNGLTTDMDADTMYSIRTYQLEDIYTLPGEYVSGEVHDEFYIDDDALQDLVIELFYVEGA